MASRQPSKQPAYTHTHTQSTPLTAEPHTHHPCVRDLICATVGLCIGRVTSWQAGGQASESLSLLSLSLSLALLVSAATSWLGLAQRWRAVLVASWPCTLVCVCECVCQCLAVVLLFFSPPRLVVCVCVSKEIGGRSASGFYVRSCSEYPWRRTFEE